MKERFYAFLDDWDHVIFWIYIIAIISLLLGSLTGAFYYGQN